MKAIHPQFITDDKGKKLSVVLSIKEFKTLLEDSEELEDIRLYDEVKAKNEKSTPLSEYIKSRKNKRRHV
ncbi:toxin-antitoxin system, antitoxin component, PHD family [Leptospira weilii str. 2006001853]|uniref:Toxin-antitoxin system, antitoxin component, PHD family n=2 Tax=Leptospira weilii TaxID=28184 RepID=A0A828Z321_9LEPT|nr:hypothetical protein [Leptospira weilii]EMM73848.1 toxin-antitoxin system, antitoxin component, PHD family [Leptospira weilii str. 2006001855]EKR65420.1 toxin-antitoxin system, antitoxin component, PHD family [Leptospira weilii str. 2006001853]QDK21640.1 hypothetical protein FHG67_01855 [Leptospira weilii]QDK25609.1 hypothetical protein FHG68_01885 [Leptospira weilii]QDK25622.1 hypothetical protein FHG68_01965 [Leptospira weilii]